MCFRSTGFWLFWLTFVSLQYNQLNRNNDACDGATLNTPDNWPSPNKSTLETFIGVTSAASLSSSSSSPSTSSSSATINSQMTPQQLTTTLPTNAGSSVHDKQRQQHQQHNVRHAKNVGIPDNFLADFKENVAKYFANDASFNRQHVHETQNSPATKQSGNMKLNTTAEPTVVGDIPHTPERRHIVPEKLQYTSEIRIKQGRLIGTIRNFHNATKLQPVDQFLGLPYAEAPVGSRRFMPPGAPLPWSGVKIARHLPPVCPQKLPSLSGLGDLRLSRARHKHLLRLMLYLKTESEDCLYLNVYVPREEGLEQTRSYPVIVYIHGESFEWNSGNPYDGSVLASYGQVVVVTVNYRLGILGFLKPGLDKQTVANFGLLDQIAALHWIKENIESFGGDKDSVTLMGHSTGAACVNYLMVSPVASGLFHRAILMSGSAMSDWAASNHTLQLTMQIAHQLNCPLSDENEEMLHCLRQKRYQDFLKIPTSFPQFSTSLGPIVDGHVIPHQPYKDMGLYTEHFSRYDLLFGVTESEAYHTLNIETLEDGLSENERDNLLHFYMQSRFDVRPDLALAATLKKYNDMYNNPHKANNQEHRDVVLDILSDARVVGPLMQTGLFHAELELNRRNYMYVFGHNSATGPYANLPHSIAGEELAFIFGAPLAPAGPFQNNYTKHEKLLAEAVMAYWTNFAKTSNPKAPWKGTFINLHPLEWDRYDLDWPEFNKRTQAYCNIGIPPSIGYKYRHIYMSFWNKELPDELNQIADIQQQPFLRVQQPGTQIPRGGTSFAGQYSSTRVGGGGEIIAGHMNKFGTRDNPVEDPLRTLKQLLKESIPPETAENMYNAPPTFGVTKLSEDDVLALNTSPPHRVHAEGPVYGVSREEPISSTSATSSTTTSSSNALNTEDTEEQQQLAKSETTLQLLIGLIIVFIVLNVLIYSTFLLQKKKKTALNKRKLAGILSYDGTTDDELKRSKHTTQNDGDDSYILDVVRSKSNTYEAVKLERSPINGYKITRQLSSSTVDTHTKVCEWISTTGERQGTLSRLPHSPPASQKCSSSPTFSSLRGSSTGNGSFTQQPNKVNVAVDATPQARSNSVLQQEPIEVTKMKADGAQHIIICQEVQVDDHELLTPQNSLDARRYSLMRQHSAGTEPCDAELPQQELDNLQQQMPTLHIEHKHSRSDPVDMYYNYNNNNSGSDIKNDEQVTSFMGATLDINVTSRDESNEMPYAALTPEQQLTLIKQRNYPKVLPTKKPSVLSWERDTDSPPMTLDLSTTNKRHSLPPNNYLLLYAPGNNATKQAPPVPPPRTISTLGRKPSLGRRRNSNNITTSPVMLAQDCTVEEEEPEITQNTLIVGPIVPKTQRRAGTTSTSSEMNALSDSQSKMDDDDDDADGTTTNNKQLRHLPPTLRLTSTTNASVPDQMYTTPPVAHHTEKVYTIETPLTPCASQPNAINYGYTHGSSYSAPTTPATPKMMDTKDMPIYAQPVKPAIRVVNVTTAPATTTTATTTTISNKSCIPRILPTSTTTATTLPMSHNNCNHIFSTTADSQLTATMTTSATATAPTITSAASATISRIPQLQRNQSFNTQQNHNQQQQQVTNKNYTLTDNSMTIKTAATTSLTPAVAASTLSTSTTATSSTSMSTSSSATSTTNTRSSSTSSTSSCSSSSTDTVCTELLKK